MSFPVDARGSMLPNKVKGAITNNCAYLFFEWRDKDGKLLGRAGANNTIWKAVGTNGWETLRMGSQRLPSEAVRGRVYIEVYRTTLGRMAFDDFEIACDVPRHVERMFSSAYRDAASDGRVRFVLPYAASREKYPVKSLSGKFTFQGVDGVFTLPADRVLPDRAEVTVDVARLAVGAHPVVASLNFNGQLLGSASLAFTRESNPTARKVYFDARGRAIVDGKPFFALGVYVHPSDHELKYLDRLKGGPFNCVIECSARKEILDRLHSLGLKAIPRSSWWKTEDIRAMYRGFRSHPAMLAWYVIDEAPATRAPDEIARQAIRREADPDHPTIAVLDYPRNVDAFMGAFDIVAADPYRFVSACRSHLRQTIRSGARKVVRHPSRLAGAAVVRVGLVPQVRASGRRPLSDLRRTPFDGVAGDCRRGERTPVVQRLPHFQVRGRRDG